MIIYGIWYTDHTTSTPTIRWSSVKDGARLVAIGSCNRIMVSGCFIPLTINTVSHWSGWYRFTRKKEKSWRPRKTKALAKCHILCSYRQTVSKAKLALFICWQKYITVGKILIFFWPVMSACSAAVGCLGSTPGLKLTLPETGWHLFRMLVSVSRCFYLKTN